MPRLDDSSLFFEPALLGAGLVLECSGPRGERGPALNRVLHRRKDTSKTALLLCHDVDWGEVLGLRLGLSRGF